MALFPRLRRLLSFHPWVALQGSVLQPRPLRSMCLPSRPGALPPPPSPPPSPSSSSPPPSDDKAPNESLLEKLNIMGVDVKRASERQPGVLRRTLTNEEGVGRFLQDKGASREVIASIISRYPRAITRSVSHLQRRWDLWRSVFASDAQILSILERSPESFFRTSDNDNLEKNIEFLMSLGLHTRHLHRMLATAPRTFANSLKLNRQMVEFLECVCLELGGDKPQEFVRAVISRNAYILIRSTKRVRANVDFLQTSLELSDADMLLLLQGAGAEILDLSNEYLQNNFSNMEQKFETLGCGHADIKTLILNYPMVLFIGVGTLNSKLDCLVQGGISIQQVIHKPKVLDFSTVNITGRLEQLKELRYDFKTNGISILDTSRKRFDAKLQRLRSAQIR